jgi:hypothetical protein
MDAETAPFAVALRDGRNAGTLANDEQANWMSAARASVGATDRPNRRRRQW